MTIYVDSLIAYGGAFYHGKDAAQAARVGARNGNRWCHMFADESDCEELHEFAAKIGMKRSWFQGDHYDLTPGRRAAAVAAGAVELGRKAAVTIWRRQREQRASTTAEAEVRGVWSRQCRPASRVQVSKVSHVRKRLGAVRRAR